MITTVRKPGGLLDLSMGIAGVLLFLLVAGENSQAQQAPAVRVYLPNTADEDWSFLRESSKRDFWDTLKYIPLGGENRYLTLSGEFRFRPEGFRVRSVEGAPSMSESYLLQRYLFGRRHI